MEAPAVGVVVSPFTTVLFCACQVNVAGMELLRLILGLCPLQMVYESGLVSVGMASMVRFMLSITVWQPLETLTQ